MAKIDDNQVYEEDDANYPFENNFIDLPWDERSQKSKFGVIALLVAISAVTAFCVSYTLKMHYATVHFAQTVDCPFITVREKEEYNFVAKIYSIASKELLCVGAVLSLDSVLADEICARNGPVLLVIGSPTHPRCKKGFSIDTDQMITIAHEGTISKKLVILESKSSFAECGTPIPIGTKLNWKLPAYIIGRPLKHTGRALTKQPVVVFGRGNCTIPSLLSQKLDSKAIICVKEFGGCRVRPGDLLVQGGQLYGMATGGVHLATSTATYFADLNLQTNVILSKVGK